MLSKHFTNKFYFDDGIELARSLHLDLKHINSKDGDLWNKLKKLAENDGRCFYELALYAYEQHMTHNLGDLTVIFTDEKFSEMYKSLQKNNKHTVSGTMYTQQQLNHTCLSLKIKYGKSS